MLPGVCLHYVLKSLSMLSRGKLSMFPTCRYFNWLFGQVNDMIEDDVRALFLEALLEVRLVLRRGMGEQ